MHNPAPKIRRAVIITGSGTANATAPDNCNRFEPSKWPVSMPRHHVYQREKALCRSDILHVLTWRRDQGYRAGIENGCFEEAGCNPA
jgi:hypothetical protein